MKLSFILLFAGIIQLFAIPLAGQNAVIQMKPGKSTMEKFINEIEKQTGYFVIFSSSEINPRSEINISSNSGTVSDYLSYTFKGTDVYYEFEKDYIILTRKPLNPSLQSGIAITGTITDENGDPMPGVNITVKGTITGVVSDMNGKYSITVSDRNAVLVFSFIGYASQELTVGDQKAINLVMAEASKEIEEVVVVGYSTLKKENLTGAVTQIKGETLENRPVLNVSQALQGSVANLNISSTSGGGPGSKQSINIRGYTGFGLDGGSMVSKSQSPLIVIDGIQGGDINSINMDDVESISVLKDAASVAIYGSSAPYGVIIINTKKGKLGKRPTITYNNNFGFSQPINLPKMMNSLDFANLYNEAAVNANTTVIFTDENIQRIKDYQSGKMKDETIANPTPGRDEWYTWTGNGNNEWFDIFFKNVSFSQQHNVGVSGGTNNSSYYIGLGYNQKNGMYNFGSDVYQRYNARVNLSSDLAKWLTVNFRSAYSRGYLDTPDTYASKTGGNYMHQIARKWPTAPLRNPNGEYSYPSDVRLMEEGGRDYTTTDQAVVTGEFVIKPLPGWDITANYTYDGTYINKSEHFKTLYVTLPSGSSVIYAGTTPNSFSRTNNKNQHHVVNLFSSFEKQIGSHYFKALLGYTQELYDNLELSASNTNLYSENLPALSLTYGTSPSMGDKASQLAIRGAFGRINYNYKEKYLVEFNGRYDGTSRFLEDVRYQFYPGVSAAWVPSKENFWEPVYNYVNFMKFRASYGSLGDQGFTDSYYPFYPSMSTVAPTSSNWLYNGGRQAYVSNPTFINSNLTWVTTTTIDFGADFAFLRNRLAVSFDWYKRSADDFVGPAEILPALLGASTPQTNNSAMVTKGVELTIGWNDRVNDFHYGANLVLSDYKSEITKYPNPTGLNTTWYKGRIVGDIWGYETYGLFQSNEEITGAPSQAKIYSQWTPGDVRYVNQNDDNEINWGNNTLDDPGDKKVIGNSTPRFSYGLTLNADYKGFDFSIFMQGVAKRDAWTGSNYFWGIVGDQWQSSPFTVHSDRWTTDNPGGYFPKFYMTSQNNKNTQAQTRYLQNAAYMRIKNVQLGYSLPKELINKINFQKVRIFLSIENMATFTKMFKTMDPEFSASDGKLYPLQRTWSCGLNVTF